MQGWQWLAEDPDAVQQQGNGEPKQWGWVSHNVGDSMLIQVNA